MQPPMPPPLLLFPMCHALLVACCCFIWLSTSGENWKLECSRKTEISNDMVRFGFSRRIRLCSSWKVFNEYFLHHSEEDPHNTPISSHYRAPMVMLWVRVEEFLFALKLSKAPCPHAQAHPSKIRTIKNQNTIQDGRISPCPKIVQNAHPCKIWTIEHQGRKIFKI